jgi:hypothetical protein
VTCGDEQTKTTLPFKDLLLPGLDLLYCAAVNPKETFVNELRFACTWLDGLKGLTLRSRTLISDCRPKPEPSRIAVFRALGMSVDSS